MTFKQLASCFGWTSHQRCADMPEGAASAAATLSAQKGEPRRGQVAEQELVCDVTASPVASTTMPSMLFDSGDSAQEVAAKDAQLQHDATSPLSTHECMSSAHCSPSSHPKHRRTGISSLILVDIADFSKLTSQHGSTDMLMLRSCLASTFKGLCMAYGIQKLMLPAAAGNTDNGSSLCTGRQVTPMFNAREAVVKLMGVAQDLLAAASKVMFVKGCRVRLRVSIHCCPLASVDSREAASSSATLSMVRDAVDLHNISVPGRVLVSAATRVLLTSGCNGSSDDWEPLQPSTASTGTPAGPKGICSSQAYLWKDVASGGRSHKVLSSSSAFCSARTAAAAGLQLPSDRRRSVSAASRPVSTSSGTDSGIMAMGNLLLSAASDLHIRRPDSSSSINTSSSSVSSGIYLIQRSSTSTTSASHIGGAYTTLAHSTTSSAAMLRSTFSAASASHHLHRCRSIRASQVASFRNRATASPRSSSNLCPMNTLTMNLSNCLSTVDSSALATAQS